MTMKALALLTAFGICGLALAQPVAIKVAFPAKGDYQVQFLDAQGRHLGEPTVVKDLMGTEVKVPAGSPVKLEAQDTKKGNFAVVPFKNAPVSFTAKDFKYAQVKVTVEHQGKPVASANVMLKDAEREQKQLLSPDMKGEVPFNQVRLGKVVASVEYKVKGEAKLAPEIHMAIDPDRTDKVPTLAFSIPDEEVATVGPEAAAKDGVPAPAATGGAGMSAGSIIVIVVALVAAAGALYGILRFVQHRQDWVKEKMDKLGVQLPSDPSDAADAQATHTSGFRQDAPPPPPLVPEGSCPYCGQVKGADGSCGCTLTGGSVAVQQGPAQPRLLGLVGPYAGEPFDATADQITIGRDPDNNVALDRDTSISRHHARLVRQGGALVVEDLGSTNGTFVNGVKVQGQQALSVGDRVQFGESQFKYEA